MELAGTEARRGAEGKDGLSAPGRRRPGSGTELELLESTDPDGPIGKFLAGKGPGVHHLAFRVEDLDAALEELKAEGMRLIDEVPRYGAALRRRSRRPPSRRAPRCPAIRTIRSRRTCRPGARRSRGVRKRPPTSSRMVSTKHQLTAEQIAQINAIEADRSRLRHLQSKARSPTK